MKDYAFGIDVGGTTIKLGFFTVSGELKDKWEIPTEKAEGGVGIIPSIACAVLEYMSIHRLNTEDIQGVGVGVPGAVLEGGIVNRCVNLGWGVVKVADELEEQLGGIPVKVGNDANVAALGEMWQGGGKGFKNLVMVTLGTGVGGGIIIDEKILPGTFGAAGEIGHIQMKNDDTECCGCGKKGCLEQYASATGIVRMAKERLAENFDETVLREINPLTSKDIFDAAGRGDAVALQIVDQEGEILGRALSYVACVVDPQAFVFGGGVSKAGQILIDAVEKHYKKFAFHASYETKFVLATLGNDAGIYGAVCQTL